MSNSQSDVRRRFGGAGKSAGLSHPRISAIALALGMALGGVIAVWPAAVFAQGVEAQYSFSIPAGNLHDALDALATQSGITVMYAPDLVAGKTCRGLSGRHAPADALQQLLKDSGLQAQQAGASSYTIKRVPTRQEPQATARKTAATQAKEPDVKELGAMTVTGSRIRGGSTPSPLITIDSEQMREEGFSDLGEVIRDIPQNFSGGQNPGVTSGASLGGEANVNYSGGSALNLRGLGPDATLTLLNGRRLSYGGYLQAVDISAIPVEAVDRFEIIPDGASAIYGSDAVAGVGNVILKRDFDGVTVGTRYGGATDGGLITREYTATAGTIWSTGGLIATWEKTASDPIYADQRGYTSSMPRPRTLYPGINSYNGLISAHQSLGDVAELRLDILKTHRDQTIYLGYPTFYYYDPRQTSTLLVSPSIEFSLPGDWSLTAGGTRGKDDYTDKQFYVTSALSALSKYCECNKIHSYEIGAEGPLFALGGGDARLAVGVGSRTDKFLYRSYTSTSQYGGEERARYAYAELNLPFISPDLDISGIHRLEFSAALRSEDYDSFGRVNTPKLGLIWDPSADLTLKASWGKSFKAPTLYQRYAEYAANLMSPVAVGGIGYPSDATVLMTYGGNPDLKPERARTWSATMAFHPEALPGLEAELTWFNIDYTNRVMTPLASYSQALSNPKYAEFIDYSPTAAEQAALLATYSTLYSYVGAAYDPSKVVAIISDQYINVAQQKIKGFDLSGSYQFDLGGGRLAIRGSASWLDSWQKNSSTQNAYDLAGTIFNPAKVKSRIGAVWTRGGFSASSFVSYISGVTSALTNTKEKTASFTTVDATLRYDTGERSDALSGLVFELSTQNLFNREPPRYTTLSPNYPPYDSTNYSAIGRFVSVSLSKHW